MSANVVLGHHRHSARIALAMPRARAVWAGDNAVDGLYSRVVHALIRAMSADQDAVTTDTYLLWVAHNLERIADRATTICERIVFGPVRMTVDVFGKVISDTSIVLMLDSAIPWHTDGRW